MSNTDTNIDNESSADATLLLATDGSDQANAALAAGLQLVGVQSAVLLVTVVPAADPGMVIGSGHAGPVMTPSEKTAMLESRDENGRAILDAAVQFLGFTADGANVDTEMLTGNAGEAICQRAESGNVSGIVIGTRGQGGFKRALLGSVSDFVVRNAPCPVVTVNIN